MSNSTENNYNLEVFQGEDRSWYFAAFSGGVPAVLTGYRVEGMIRASEEAPNALLTMDSAVVNSGLTVLTNGVRMSVARAASAPPSGVLPLGSSVYDLFLISPGNMRVRFVGGVLFVKRSMTRVAGGV